MNSTASIIRNIENVCICVYGMIFELHRLLVSVASSLVTKCIGIGLDAIDISVEWYWNFIDGTLVSILWYD